MEKNLDGSCELPAGARQRGPCGAGSHAVPQETRGQNARVVEYHEFLAAEQLGKFRELAVLPVTASTAQHQEARSIAAAERPLGNLTGRQVVTEFFDSHLQSPTITDRAK